MNNFDPNSYASFMSDMEGDVAVVDLVRGGDDGVMDTVGDILSEEQVMRRVSYDIVRDIRDLRASISRARRYDRKAVGEWVDECFPSLVDEMHFVYSDSLSEAQVDDVMALLKAEPGLLYGDKAEYFRTQMVISEMFGSHDEENRPEYDSCHKLEDWGVVMHQDERAFRVKMSKSQYEQPIPVGDGWGKLKRNAREIYLRIGGKVYDIATLINGANAKHQDIMDRAQAARDDGKWNVLRQMKDAGQFKKYPAIARFLRDLQTNFTYEAERMVGGMRRSQINGHDVVVDDSRVWFDGTTVQVYAKVY